MRGSPPTTLQPPVSAAALKPTSVSGISLSNYPANMPIEDRHAVAVLRGGIALGCVFDGHGGWQAAEFAERHLAGNIDHELALKKDPHDPEQVADALRRAFEATDRQLADRLRPSFEMGFEQVSHVGACALSVALTRSHLIVGNAGDCRAVLGKLPVGGRRWETVTLSYDHNCKLPREKALLEQAHPGEADIVRCKHPNACYVKGRLQPTRSLGDFYLKLSEFNNPVRSQRWRGRHIPEPYTPPYISATPEITIHDLDLETDKFVVLACDGVWDALTSEEVVDFVAHDEGDKSTVATRLAQHVLDREAESAGLSPDQLMSLPQGRTRRNVHDDITILVLYVGSPGGAVVSYTGGDGGKGRSGARGNGDGEGDSGAKGKSGGLWSKLFG